MIVASSPDVTLPRIDLAAVPDFELGGALVRPSRRQICWGEGEGRELEPRVAQVLVALAMARGSVVSRDQLIDSCWDGRIVGDDSLNRVIVALRRLAKEIEPQPFAIETVPRVGYLLMEAQLGQSLSTPEAASDLPAGREPLQGRILAGIALVVLLIIAGGLYLWLGRTPSGSEAPQVRLATFRTSSPDLPQSIADSFREELENAAGGDETLMFVAADAKGLTPSPDLQLSGTVRQIGGARRYTVQLRNIRSGATLWSQAYDRQDNRPQEAREVATVISQVLWCGLLFPAERLPRMKDLQLILWFKICSSPDDVSPDAKLDLARRATEAMPDFAMTWANRAMWSVPFGPRLENPADLLAESKAAADRALQLDPGNSRAWFARALHIVRSDNHAEVERRYQKALEGKPTNAGWVYGNYAIFLQRVGRLEDAKPQFQRAYDLSPQTPEVADGWATILLYLREDEEGVRLLDRNLSLWPDESDILSTAVRTGFWTGKHGRASAALANPNWQMHPRSREALAAAVEALRSERPNDRARAVALAMAAAKDPRTNRSQIPSALAALGEDRAAIEAVRALSDRDGIGMLFSPSFARVRHTPEFVALVTDLGYVRYWRETKKHPDFCRQPRAPAWCKSL